MKAAPKPKAREQYLAHTTTCAACAAVERKMPGASRCRDGCVLALDVLFSEPILARAKPIGGGK